MSNTNENLTTDDLLEKIDSIVEEMTKNMLELLAEVQELEAAMAEARSILSEQKALAITWPNVSKPRPERAASRGVSVGSKTAAQVGLSRTSRANVLRTTVARDARNRACITAEITRDISLEPGDVVYIARRSGGPGLVVLTKPTKNGSQLASYRVDSYGNIRLSSGLLRKAGLNNATDIKFRVSNNKSSIIVVAG